jgi:hypothetical protein
VRPPPDIDGVSFWPTLLDQSVPEPKRDLYFVRREGGKRYDKQNRRYKKQLFGHSDSIGVKKHLDVTARVRRMGGFDTYRMNCAT